MKKKLIKLCTSFIPLLLFQNLTRYRFMEIGSAFTSKGDADAVAKDIKERAEVKPFDGIAEHDGKQSQLCFLLGSPRSGTTLTSILLDKSPEIFSPPELYLATFESLKQRSKNIKSTIFKALSMGLVQSISKFTGKSHRQSLAFTKGLEKQDVDINQTYDYLLSNTDQPVFIDKTPCYVTYMAERLFSKRFPKAKYLYMYRHPISVILSQKRWVDEVSDEDVKKYGKKGIEAYHQRKTGLFSMLLANPESYWEFEAHKADYYPKCDYDKFKILEGGWFYENNKTMQFLDTVPEEQKYIFSFESLLKNPEQELQKILAFLEIDSDPAAMVDAYESRKAPTTIRGILKEVWNWEVGDPNQIFLAGKIDGSRADQSWQKNAHLWEKLNPETRELAKRMGYPEPDTATKGEAGSAAAPVPAEKPAQPTRAIAEPA